GLSAALALLRAGPEQRFPIVIRMRSEAGLAALLRGEDSGGRGFDRLWAFPLLDRTCTPELLLGGTNETLARLIHEEYVRQQQRLGQTPKTNPSMVPWDELPEGLKESNRRQADDIGRKLRRVGYCH